MSPRPRHRRTKRGLLRGWTLLSLVVLAGAVAVGAEMAANAAPTTGQVSGASAGSATTSASAAAAASHFDQCPCISATKRIQRQHYFDRRHRLVGHHHHGSVLRNGARPEAAPRRRLPGAGADGLALRGQDDPLGPHHERLDRSRHPGTGADGGGQRLHRMRRDVDQGPVARPLQGDADGRPVGQPGRPLHDGLSGPGGGQRIPWTSARCSSCIGAA